MLMNSTINPPVTSINRNRKLIKAACRVKFPQSENIAPGWTLCSDEKRRSLQEIQDNSALARLVEIHGDDWHIIARQFASHFTPAELEARWLRIRPKFQYRSVNTAFRKLPTRSRQTMGPKVTFARPLNRPLQRLNCTTTGGLLKRPKVENDLVEFQRPQRRRNTNRAQSSLSNPLNEQHFQSYAESPSVILQPTTTVKCHSTSSDLSNDPCLYPSPCEALDSLPFDLMPQGSTMLDWLCPMDDSPLPRLDPLISEVHGGGVNDPFLNPFNIPSPIGEFESICGFSISPPHIMSPPPPPPQPAVAPAIPPPPRVNFNSIIHPKGQPGRVVNLASPTCPSTSTVTVIPRFTVHTNPGVSGKPVVKQAGQSFRQTIQHPLQRKQTFSITPTTRRIITQQVPPPRRIPPKQQPLLSWNSILAANKNDSIALSTAKMTVWNRAAKTQQAAVLNQRTLQTQQHPFSVLRPFTSSAQSVQIPARPRLAIPATQQPQLGIRRVIQIGNDEKWRQVACGESSPAQSLVAMARDLFDDSLSSLFN